MAAGGRGSSTLLLVDKIQMGIVMGQMEQSKLYDNVKTTKVLVEGTIEEVEMDPLHGPLELHPDGSKRPANCAVILEQTGRQPVYSARYRKWAERTATEQEILVNIIAKKNRRMKEHPGHVLPDFLARDFKTVGNTPRMAWEDWTQGKREAFVMNMMNSMHNPEASQKQEKAKAKTEEAPEMRGPAWMQQDWGWMPNISLPAMDVDFQGQERPKKSGRK